MAADAVPGCIADLKASVIHESAAENLDKYGQNVLSESGTRSDLSILRPVQISARCFAGCCCWCFIFTGELADALVIMGVVGVNAIIGYTESQSEGLFIPLGVVKANNSLICNGCRTEISRCGSGRYSVLKSAMWQQMLGCSKLIT